MSETIAFCGLGRMGLAMARNAAAAGFRVQAWNRTRGKAAGSPGLEEKESPRAAAGGASLAVTMLADDAAVEAVVFGESGLLAGLPRGAVHVGMSTCSVALTRRLVEEHGKAGHAYVAAPVFGRPDAAEKKLLFIVPGGDEAALARCQPLFAALGQGTFPMPGAAQASLAKLVGNFCIASTIEMLGESLSLGEKAGIAPEALLGMLAGTIFGSPVVKGYGARIAATEYEPAGFAMPLGLKDVKLALQAAQELGVPLPLAELARGHLEGAIAKGRSGWDWGGLTSVIREAAGLPAKRS